jgi:hypothetical protein
MAKLSTEDLLGQFKEMTLVEQLQQQAAQQQLAQLMAHKMSSQLSWKTQAHRRLQLSRKFVDLIQALA